jgi:hypothetical protein
MVAAPRLLSAVRRLAPWRRGGANFQPIGLLFVAVGIPSTKWLKVTPRWTPSSTPSRTPAGTCRPAAGLR